MCNQYSIGWPQLFEDIVQFAREVNVPGELRSAQLGWTWLDVACPGLLSSFVVLACCPGLTWLAGFDS